jgi:murein DD-endopeptidase MepM/ murein hydrolase activator NlpD
MIQLQRLRARFDALFTERHLYLRSGGEMRAFVFTRRRQMTAAAVMTVTGLWLGVSTAATVASLINGAEPASVAPLGLAQAQVAATLASAPADAAALAARIEQRHAALALLLTEARDAPGAAQALAPPIAQALAAAAGTRDPIRRLELVEASQQQVLAAADHFARARSQRLRQAMRLAGVAPAAAPLVQPIALTSATGERANLRLATMTVDSRFDAAAGHAAADLAEVRSLDQAVERLPLARPAREARESSGFGRRSDPFTHRAAFHPGLDFAGRRMSPVLATAGGVVAFAGMRPGYGRTVEVDHGRGFRTRYAHLARIGVRVGQRVVAGADLGGMGSSGRSTGTHLHYEVWRDGRLQDPARFVRAGAYAAQPG